MKQLLAAAVTLAALASIATSQATGARDHASQRQAGIAQFDAENLGRARAMLTPLANAGDAEAMYYLGRIAIEQSDGDEAVTWLEQAIKKNDRSSVYHQWLSTAYSVKGSAANPIARMTLVPAMTREMDRAVELDSANIEARVNLIQFYLQAPAVMGGGVDKAKAQVASLMLRNPYQARLQDATISENLKDTAAAERTLRDLTVAFPDSAAPIVRLATIYVGAKRYDEAFRVVEDRLHRLPDDAPALYQLGRVGAASGTQLDRARGALDRYLKLPHKRGTPTFASAHWRLGMILEAGGDAHAAIAEYEAALRLDPNLAGAKASLAKLTKLK